MKLHTATQLYLFQAKQHDAVGYAEEAMRLEPPESPQMSEKSGWTANAKLNWLLKFLQSRNFYTRLGIPPLGLGPLKCFLGSHCAL